MKSDITESTLLEYFHGELTPLQEAAVREWAGADEENRLLFDQVQRDYLRLRWATRVSLIKGDTKIRKPLPHRKIIWGRIAAAVAACIVLAVGGWLYFGDRIGGQNDNQIARYENDIRLILPDGSQVVLDQTTENGLVAEQGDISLVRENGKLIHEKTATGSTPAELRWSTVKVPRGALFNMVLEDGTQVWLNADSRLRFPIEFTGGERRVILEGEAYFAVAKNAKKPFIVETSGQNITVLGTEFNVYAYPQATAQYTTLVEGSVSLSSGDKSVVITPGQQAALYANSDQFVVQKVNTSDILAWRNGMFVFEGNTFDEVFRKLSRWYNFDYTFMDEDLSRLTFSGSLRQTDNIQPIFEIIETMAHIKINVKGSNVKITRK